MPRIRTAYVVALWSAITMGAVVAIWMDEAPRLPAETGVTLGTPVTLASAGHREDALGNRYRTRTSW